MRGGPCVDCVSNLRVLLLGKPAALRAVGGTGNWRRRSVSRRVLSPWDYKVHRSTTATLSAVVLCVLSIACAPAPEARRRSMSDATRAASTLASPKVLPAKARQEAVVQSPTNPCTRLLDVLAACATQTRCEPDVSIFLPGAARSKLVAAEAAPGFSEDAFDRYCLKACQAGSAQIDEEAFTWDVCANPGAKHEKIASPPGWEKYQTPAFNLVSRTPDIIAGMAHYDASFDRALGLLLADTMERDPMLRRKLLSGPAADGAVWRVGGNPGVLFTLCQAHECSTTNLVGFYRPESKSMVGRLQLECSISWLGDITASEIALITDTHPIDEDDIIRSQSCAL